jgi:hypothetical protein
MKFQHSSERHNGFNNPVRVLKGVSIARIVTIASFLSEVATAIYGITISYSQAAAFVAFSVILLVALVMIQVGLGQENWGRMCILLIGAWIALGFIVVIYNGNIVIPTILAAG